MRTLFGIFALAGALFGANVTTFYDPTQWIVASQSAVLETETFSNNQLNAPWLTITSCLGGPNVVTLPPSQLCQTIGAGGNTVGNGQVIQNMWTDATGRLPNNSFNGFDGQYRSTTFNLPSGIFAVGFDINALPASIATDPSAEAFNIVLSSVNQSDNVGLFPFGGGDHLQGGNNTAYDGFVGFISDTPITGIEINSGDPTYILDNLQIATPEPGNLAITGVGIGFRSFGG